MTLQKYMLQVDKATWERFKERCRSEGRSMAFVIRQLILNYLKG